MAGDLSEEEKKMKSKTGITIRTISDLNRFIMTPIIVKGNLEERQVQAIIGDVGVEKAKETLERMGEEILILGRNISILEKRIQKKGDNRSLLSSLKGMRAKRDELVYTVMVTEKELKRLGEKGSGRVSGRDTSAESGAASGGGADGTGDKGRESGVVFEADSAEGGGVEGSGSDGASTSSGTEDDGRGSTEGGG